MHNRHPIELTPLHQISVLTSKDGAAGWRASGNDPQFLLNWGGQPISGGWYVLSGTAEVLRGRLHAPVLYPTYGHETHEHDRIDLPLEITRGKRHSFSTLVRFNETVSSVRFDPSIAPTDFHLEDLSLSRVGRFRALQEMLSTLTKRRRGAVARIYLLGRTVFDLITGGASKVAARLYSDYRNRVAPSVYSDYEIWQDFYDCRDDAWHGAEAHLAALQHRPLVSVLVPTYNTTEKWLRRCIESVREQVYPNWELCIADDASTDPRVAEVLSEYASLDQRIRFQVRQTNGHISEASNTALQMAKGEFAALLDHDDELHPMALFESVRAFEVNPEWEMLYTDEDKIDTAGVRSDPYFKSDWNPDLFLSQNCICHLTVYRSQQIRNAGGFRKGYEGAQDWDLALRVTEKLAVKQIGHVPKVLYHWRMIPGSTATAASEKSYAHMAGLRSVQDHLDRMGHGAKVRETEGSGYFQIEHPLPAKLPLVSLLIPTRDRIDLLKQCIDSIIERTEYDNYEVIVIDNDSQEQSSKDYFAAVQKDPRVRVIAYPHPFNYSAINNAGAQAARGTVLGLLNNDIEVISPRWLHEMVAHALRPQTGVVGAMLYYPNDTIQHAGVIVGVGGVAGHCYVGMPRGWLGDKSRARLAQNLSAVTAACVVVRREVFDQVGGLDEGLQVAFNDVDFCLRVRDAGYLNVWTPFAELYHHESASRGYETTPEKVARFNGEIDFMKSRWGQNLDHDPYYNVNLSLNSTPFSLAYPPRVWQ